MMKCTQTLVQVSLGSHLAPSRCVALGTARSLSVPPVFICNVGVMVVSVSSALEEVKQVDIREEQGIAPEAR